VIFILSKNAVKIDIPHRVVDFIIVIDVVVILMLLFVAT
jgi:hypothetical protein